MKIKNDKKVYDNFSHVEGWLYDASKLSFRETGANSKNPGTKYIGGSIDIATNDELTNIVTVNFTYELPTFSTGTKNERYDTLAQIINGDIKTVLGAGKENAAVLKIDGRVGVNEYYSDKSGEIKLTSFKVNEGGFMHVISASALAGDPAARATFQTDVLIHTVTVKEADPDRGLPEKAVIKGFIFDYANRLLPVEFDAIHEGAISYFESLGASNSNPILTKIRGVQVNEIIKRSITVESAWGEEVKEVENTNRSWKITWAQPDVYEFDTPETLTAQELTEALAARKTREAELRTQYDQRQNKSAATTQAGAFNF